MQGTSRPRCWATSPTVLVELDLVTQPHHAWRWYSGGYSDVLGLDLAG